MKYSPGLLVGQLSRSVGSTTASHNRFGPYFRSRVIPVNPNTSTQVTQRQFLHDASQGWRGLTANQRAAWTALGLEITRTDTLGVPYTLTGLQAYTSFYRTAKYIGGTALSDAPALVAVTAVASVTPTATQ